MRFLLPCCRSSSGYLNSFGFSNLPATSEIKIVLNVLTALELREISKQTLLKTAPLDRYTDSLYTSRQSLIESHLEKIYKGMTQETLIISWESHVGTACQGVNWDRHSLDDLRAIVSCISGPCLVSLCWHLAQDYRSWSSGMPDLLLWRFLGEKQRGEVKLVEVKGPRDRLSEQQRACVLLLMDYGLVYVSWYESIRCWIFFD